MARKAPKKPKPLSAEWRKLLRLIPGYDPFASAVGCWFDEAAAQDAIDFFPECLRHVEGAMSGKPFALEPWQQSVVANLFGWKRKDAAGREVRRFRESLLYVSRKNGKSPLAAGIGLYVFFCDNERGQQDYIAAGEREQAGMLFRHAKGMVEQEPELRARCRIYGGNAAAGQSKSIVREQDGSFLRVIAADAQTQHGGNTHLAIIDELHVQPNRELVDVLRTSMASQNRAQPLLLFITTADYGRESICNEVYDYACKVRDGIIDDQAFLPVIYEAARDDDWTIEATWRKANPNLDVSVSLDYLRRECGKAMEIPAYENTFKRLHLNIITEQDQRCIPMDQWDRLAGEFDEASLEGRECFCGLDLSTKIDITAAVLVFPPATEGEPVKVLPYLFVPQDNCFQRSHRDRVPYDAWARDGWLIETPGNVIDHAQIRRKLNELHEKFHIREVAIDPWNSQPIATELAGDGFEVIEFRQGFASMNDPTKELLKLVASGDIVHGGHPVLRWMASNLATESDAAGNLKPSKKKSTERIDGMVALIMALGRSTVADEGYVFQPGTLAL